MVKKRIKTCWLLLLVVVYTGGLVLSVGETEARYVNTANWSTMIGESSTAVTSDCLVGKTDIPMTVLLGEGSLLLPTKVSFWLKSTDSTALEGDLVWKVVETDYVQYLKVEMMSGVDVLENGSSIKLVENTAMDFTMILTPTDNARIKAHDELLIHIVVGWGDSMRGIFQIMLPEVKAEEPEEDENGEAEDNTGGETQPEDETVDPTQSTEESVETEDGTTEAEPTAVSDGGEETQVTPEETTAQTETIPTETGESTNEVLQTQSGTTGDESETTTTESPTEPVETDPTVPNETQATEPTETTTDPTETQATEPVTTDPTESTETQPEEPSEPDPTEESIETEPAEPPTEPEETAPEETDPLVKLETLKSFSPQSLLPAKITLNGGITRVSLGLGTVNQDGTAGEIQPFPAYTRFSLDDGASYYMMYRGYVTELNTKEVSSVTILLDFSRTELDTDSEVFLLAEGYDAEGSLLSTCIVNTSPDAMEDYQVESRPLVQTAQTEDEETEEEASTQEPKILTQDTYLEFTLPEAWKDYKLEYSIEILTLNAESKLEYVPAEYVGADEKNNGSLVVDYVNDENSQAHKLILLTGAKLPQAGTYRVNMNWSYEGICYEQTQTTFFINYPASTIAAE